MMTRTRLVDLDRVALVRAFFRDFRVTEAGFLLGGVEYPVTEAGGRTLVSRIDVLESCIYRGLHARDPRFGSTMPSVTPSHRLALMAELSAASPGGHAWHPGWTVTGREGDLLVVTRGGVSFLADPGEVRTSNGRAEEGTEVWLRIPAVQRSVNHGFYTVMGSAPQRAGERTGVRLYWNVHAEAAPRLLAHLVAVLDAGGMPFTFKTASEPEDYARSDAAVLYLDRDDLVPAMDLLGPVYQDLRDGISPEVSVFAYQLAPGLSAAEHLESEPHSFGQVRSRELAEAVLAAFSDAGPTDHVEGGEGLDDARLDDVGLDDRGMDLALDGAFRKMGWKWTRSYLWSDASEDFEGLTLEGADERNLPYVTRGAGPATTDVGSFRLLDAARRFADFLHERAIRSDDRCTWMAYGDGDADAPVRYATLGPDVYEGVAGVALFLCEMHRVDGRSQDAELARAALRQAAYLLDSGAYGGTRTSRGYYTGMGGVVHALAYGAGVLDDRELRDAARRWFDELADVPAHPDQLDIIAGNAGMIAPLLDLSEWLDDGNAERLAYDWADELVRSARRSDKGWMWDVEGISRPLAGFSHGASGFGWALSVAHAAFGEDRFLKGMQNAFAFEDSLFDPTLSNWPDLRDADAREEGYSVRATETGNRRFMVAWCHGA
ncbi:MAG: T3SS effector HopA1 family protein, partial [Rhodothermales bacterium]